MGWMDRNMNNMSKLILNLSISYCMGLIWTTWLGSDAPLPTKCILYLHRLIDIIQFLFTQGEILDFDGFDAGADAETLQDAIGRSRKTAQSLFRTSTIEEFISNIKQIHFWYFWEKQVSLTEFIHMSMGEMYLRELSGSKFHSVTSTNVILYNDVKNSIFIKSGFIWFWNWALQFSW